MILAGPELAYAHASFPGAEGFVRGIAQPLQEPVQGLLSGTCGVLIGRANPRRMGPLWLAYCCTTAGAACLLAFVGSGAEPVPLALLLGALLATGLLLTAWARPPFVVSVLLVISGGAVAGSNALSIGAIGQLETTGGSLAGSAMLALYLAAATHWLRRRERARRWLQLMPRVAGAWVTAFAVLGLAFTTQTTS